MFSFCFSTRLVQQLPSSTAPPRSTEPAHASSQQYSFSVYNAFSSLSPNAPCYPNIRDPSSDLQCIRRCLHAWFFAAKAEESQEAENWRTRLSQKEESRRFNDILVGILAQTPAG